MSAEPWVIAHRHAHDTELEAADAARKKYPEFAWRVLSYLGWAGDGMGATDHEGTDALNTFKDSYAPARHALMRKGYVEDSGVRRPNIRGRNCIVWSLTSLGWRSLRAGQFLEEE